MAFKSFVDSKGDFLSIEMENSRSKSLLPHPSGQQPTMQNRSVQLYAAPPFLLTVGCNFDGGKKHK